MTSPASRSSAFHVYRQRVGRWLLLIALWVATLALGAVHTPVLFVVFALSAAATLSLWLGTKSVPGSKQGRGLIALAVMLALYTGMQAVPLPMEVLRALSPSAHEIWSRCLTPLGETGPTWAPLTLDPVGTRIELLKWVVVALVFTSALRVARDPSGVRFLSLGVIALVITVAILAFAHPALGLTKVYGIYAPRSALDPRHIAPLLNPNHLAGLLNLGIMLALSLSFGGKAERERFTFGAIVVGLIAMQVYVASRGGLLAMVIGLGVAFGMHRWADARGSRRTLHIAAAIVLCASLLSVMGLASSEAAYGELSDASTTKLSTIGDAFSLARRYPLFGVGRGAFEAAFPQVSGSSEYIVFTHPENLVAQWLAEWGFVVGGAALVALVVLLWPRGEREDLLPKIGPVAALAAAFCHNMVDFHSEVPGVMLCIVVCAALVLAGPTVETKRPFVRLGKGLVGTALALGAASVLLLLAHTDHEVGSERHRFRALATSPETEPESFRRELRAALLRHPAEPYIPYAGALWARRTRAESVLPYAARSLELAKTYGRAHFVVAEALAGRSPSQARMEFRLAYTQDRAFFIPALLAGAKLVSGPTSALDLVPASGTLRPKALAFLAGHLDETLPATRIALDETLATVAPDDLSLLRRRARDAHRDVLGGSAAPWCQKDRAACIASATLAIEAYIAAAPRRCEGRAWSAQLTLQSGDSGKAIDALEKAVDLVDDRTTCLREIVALAVQAKDEIRTTTYLERLSRASCATDQECADNLVYCATVDTSRGNPRRALVYLERALERAPARDDIALRIARTATDLGLFAKAVHAYDTLEKRHPNHPVYREEAGKVRTRLAAEVAPKKR